MSSLETQAPPLEPGQDLASDGPPEHAANRRRIEVAVFLGFLAASVYGTWPLALHATTRVPGNLLDPLLNVYLYSWGAHAVLHTPLDIFHAGMFHPEPYALAFTENDLGQSLPVAPIFWLTGNGTLTVNVAAILMYAVSGFGAYRLAGALGAPRSCAVVAGLVFGLAPYRLSQIGHPHVVAVHLMPFVLLLCVRLRDRPRRWVVPVLGATLALQFWSSLSGAVMTLCAVLAWAVWEAACYRRQALTVLISAAKAMALTLVLILPLLYPYFQARAQHPEYTHAPGEVFDYSATLRSYLSPWEGGPVFEGPSRWLEGLFPKESSDWEKHLFPGWTVSITLLGVLCAGILLLMVRRRRPATSLRDVGLAGVILFTSFIVSLGPRWDAQPDGVPLPFEVLNRLTPGRLLRVPARFGSVVALGLGLALAFAFKRVRPDWRRSLVGVFLVAFLLESMPQQTVTLAPPEITAAHRAIKGRPGAVLALPTSETFDDGSVKGLQERETANLYLATAHFRPLVNGYSAFSPTSYWDMVHAVQDFPSGPSMKALDERDVRTVVIQTALTPGTRWRDTADRLDRWPGVRLIAESAGVKVYDIARATGP